MTTPLRILFVTGDDPAAPSGVGDCVRRLSAALAPAAEAHPLFLPTLADGGLARLRAELAACDLVHVHVPGYAWRHTPLPSLVPLLARARPGGRAHVVVTFHEWGWLHPLRRLSFAPLALGADAAIFASGVVRDTMTLPVRHAHVIPVGANVTVHRPGAGRAFAMRRHLGIGDDERLLIHFGDLYESKQPDRVIGVLAALRARGLPARLLLVGRCLETRNFGERVLDELLRDLGVQDHVIRHGPEPDETRLADLVAASDAAIALYADGLSARRSTFHYLAQFGIPLLVTRPASAAEFADRPDVLTHPALRWTDASATAEEMARALPLDVPWRYAPFPGLEPVTWDAIAARHLGVYRAVMAQSRTPA